MPPFRLSLKRLPFLLFRKTTGLWLPRMNCTGLNPILKSVAVLKAALTFSNLAWTDCHWTVLSIRMLPCIPSLLKSTSSLKSSPRYQAVLLIFRLLVALIPDVVNGPQHAPPPLLPALLYEWGGGEGGLEILNELSAYKILREASMIIFSSKFYRFSPSLELDILTLS